MTLDLGQIKVIIGMVNSYCKNNNTIAKLTAICKNCKIKNLCFLKAIKQDDETLFEEFLQNKIHIGKNQHLYHKDAKFKSMFLVFSGSLKSYINSHQGKEQITRFYLPGDLIGLEALHQDQYSQSIKALENTTLIEMKQAKLETFLNTHPSQQSKLIELMAREMAISQNLSMILRIKSAESRFSAFLLDLSERYKHVRLSPETLNISMSRNDIANYLQLAIETISRVSSQFQRDNLIISRRNQITILDYERLLKISGHKSKIQSPSVAGGN